MVPWQTEQNAEVQSRGVAELIDGNLIENRIVNDLQPLSKTLRASVPPCLRV